MDSVSARRAMAVLEYAHASVDPFWHIFAEHPRWARVRWVEWLVEARPESRRLYEEGVVKLPWAP